MAEHSMVKTTFPVLLPEVQELRLEMAEFDSYITTLLRPVEATHTDLPTRAKTGVTEVKTEHEEASTKSQPTTTSTPFKDALLAYNVDAPQRIDEDKKMLTDNGDAAFRTSGQSLVDLFYELEDLVSSDRLSNLLAAAWMEDPEATLKIIWNARSIHLGKSSRSTFYRAVGWLAKEHPRTLLVNLPWLVRPLVAKKASKKDEKATETEKKDSEWDTVDAADSESDFEMVDEKVASDVQPAQKRQKIEDDPKLAEFDVKYGVAHGYWKDILNILALAANDELKVDGNPRAVLNVEKQSETRKAERDWSEGRKKRRLEVRHKRVVEKLANDPFYKALHLTVARLFAEQLRTDLLRLNSGQKSELKHLSLAAKWAPSPKSMHDQHTFIVSSIAELLHPFDEVCPTADPADRALYIKHARLAYQLKTLSPLRKALQVVERSITANKFEDIKYDRLPSLAMKRYTDLFARKDFERFDKYIEKVASGKARISGATLLPSTLVAEVSGRGMPRTKQKGTNALVTQKLRDIQNKSLDGQWNALVKRIRDSGSLESSIAVCDVSGSMSYPRFPDGTCPMDSAIGLSLLMAEVVAPPFGGMFITFSSNPQVQAVGGLQDSRSLQEKVAYMQRSDWGMNTDFVAVFEKLILPMAIKNKLKKEDMVKQVFVFSDMQFDSARTGPWASSFKRIEKSYNEAGYDMPKLIFWNLAGRRSGTAPKPVEADEPGTALVSGYSQGQLKMFLDKGQFDEPESKVVVESQEDGDAVVVEKTEKTKEDPMATVRKAVSHQAYKMLRVVD